MDIEYWKARLESGINYDTMVGWNQETIDDETSKLWEAMRTFWGPGQAWAKVMDYGCGRARFYKHFTALGTKYIGTDILEAVIDDNQIRYPEAEFRYSTEYEYWDLENLDPSIRTQCYI